MSFNQQHPQQEKRPQTLLILAVVVVALLGLIITLMVLFKPEPIDTKTEGVKSSPKQHIRSINPALRKVYNLTSELLLFEELTEELIYSESPDKNLIGDFVSNYKDMIGTFRKNTNSNASRAQVMRGSDTSKISFDLQHKYLKSSAEQLLQSIESKKKLFISLPVTFPIEKEKARIVSGFGMRDHPILNKRRMHNGIDIGAPVGTPVIATANGKVIKTSEKTGYGRSCLIEHKFGYQTLYGHLVRLTVAKNQWVQKGEVVGYVGNTGLSVAPHLHYEIRKNGKMLNPSFLIFEGLDKAEYKEVIRLGSKKNEILSF